MKYSLHYILSLLPIDDMPPRLVMSHDERMMKCYWCCVGRAVTGRDNEICRDKIVLDEMLGVGQFGDVFRGIFTQPVQ